MRLPDSPTGRLAPSPTGGLHLGHARTFLIAWLSARSRGGRMIYRVEDLDPSRARLEAIAEAQTDLRWLGLDWDAGPYVQSQRTAAYTASLERLKASELVYPCTCTRADIARAASAPHAEDEGPTYPGLCAGRSVGDADTLGDRPYCWRFRVPQGPISWLDRVRGPIKIDPSHLGGDFIVDRPGVGPSYQLAVVHDDATMGVTEVIRGDDLLPSTPRQILLYRALGWSPPEFGHLPLAVGRDGRRLAKRAGAPRLSTLRLSGLDPARLVGWLARSCGWSDRVEPSGPARWIDRFELATIPREPWVVDVKELTGT